MATARMAVSSLLGTVTDTATAVSSIVSTVSDGSGMLHDYVKDARRKQKLRIIADEDDYVTRLTEDRAKENTQRRCDINDWVKDNPEKKEIYQAELNRLKKLFEVNE
jgi:hypothetical protein